MTKATIAPPEIFLFNSSKWIEDQFWKNKATLPMIVRTDSNSKNIKLQFMHSDLMDRELGIKVSPNKDYFFMYGAYGDMEYNVKNNCFLIFGNCRYNYNYNNPNGSTKLKIMKVDLSVIAMHTGRDNDRYDIDADTGAVSKKSNYNLIRACSLDTGSPHIYDKTVYKEDLEI